MYVDAVGCWVNRFTVETRIGRGLSDSEWKKILEEVDCDSVEDAIVDMAVASLEGGMSNV